jgi:glucan phosphoethanolaminetransferase (alkaline phosphatase superfamily)
MRLHEALRTAWRWRFVWLMNAFLISPVLLYELRIGDGGPDKTIVFLLAASICSLLAAQVWTRRIWVAHALMFPLYLAVGTDIYCITHYRMRLASGMLLTISENLEDAQGYLLANWKGMAILLAAVLAGYAICMVKIRQLRLSRPRWVPPLALGALAGVYLAVHHVLGLWMWVATNDRSSPFGIVSQSITAGALYRDALRDAEQAKGFTFGATRPAPPKDPEIYVLVIGESSRALDWQLYGYSRETNPRLSAERNLVVFRNVVTQAAVTRRSVPLILTRGTIEDEGRTAREKSIISAFHEAGFETYWLSTQQRDPFTGAINRYPREADVTRFFDRRPDGALVETVKEMLAHADHDKLLFVLHTLGSHFTYTSRYPREFARFPDEGDGLSERQRTVNAYDDTILYTDEVLSELIDVLRQRPGIKGLFYVSDHGENLRDDSRELFGHYLNNEYDLPIPMLFWYSSEFALRYPEKISAARVNATRPLNTRVVFHSLADMAGIDVHDADTARLSVFSPKLITIRRMVLGEPRPFDFDRWRIERHLQVPGID